MKYAELANIDKKLSVICLGAGHLGTEVSAEDSFRVLDRFVELGGTFIDTAHVYGGGKSEEVIGEWLASRGMASRMAVATKGAHPDLKSGASRLNRADIATQIAESLERLGTDVIDLYWIHLDEPAIPAIEILGMLTEHLAAGRFKAIGCSNFTVERQQEATAAAAELEITGFVASQVGWSLARANDVHGAMLFIKPDMLDYHVANRRSLVAHCGQAGGFFAAKFDAYQGLAAEAWDDVPEPDPGGSEPTAVRYAYLVHRYGNELSYRRREAAVALAAEKGYSANQIALAWMLHHPFPVFAIAGPKSPGQVDDTMRAVDIELTDEEFERLTAG